MPDQEPGVTVELQLDPYQLVNEEAPRIFKTHNCWPLSDDPIHESLAKLGFLATGFIFIAKPPQSGWQVCAALSSKATDSNFLLETSVPQLESYRVLPADRKLVLKAEAALKENETAWGMIVTGITGSGILLPPFLFWPEGFDWAEAIAICQHAIADTRRERFLINKSPSALAGIFRPS